uniref:DUF1664 domain-containing protein n=1 Tax=Oryza glumipatula TaxID=40148 RepID=A0A0E0AZ34_9ORYZ
MGMGIRRVCAWALVFFDFTCRITRRQLLLFILVYRYRYRNTHDVSPIQIYLSTLYIVQQILSPITHSFIPHGTVQIISVKSQRSRSIPPPTSLNRRMPPPSAPHGPSPSLSLSHRASPRFRSRTRDAGNRSAISAPLPISRVAVLCLTDLPSPPARPPPIPIACPPPGFTSPPTPSTLFCSTDPRCTKSSRGQVAADAFRGDLICHRSPPPARPPLIPTVTGCRWRTSRHRVLCRRINVDHLASLHHIPNPGLPPPRPAAASVIDSLSPLHLLSPLHYRGASLSTKVGDLKEVVVHIQRDIKTVGDSMSIKMQYLQSTANDIANVVGKSLENHMQLLDGQSKAMVDRNS